MNAPSNDPVVVLPFLFDGDAMVLNLGLADKHVTILSIDVYPDNQNTAARAESFRDLAPHRKRAVINHINRKYPGKMIHT